MFANIPRPQNYGGSRRCAKNYVQYHGSVNTPFNLIFYLLINRLKTPPNPDLTGGLGYTNPKTVLFNKLCHNIDSRSHNSYLEEKLMKSTISGFIRFGVYSALLSMTLMLVVLSSGVLLITYKHWQLERQHLALRSFGFMEQWVDRTGPAGTEIRTIQFECPRQPGHWLSFNQIGVSDLFIRTCDGTEAITTIPWWFPLLFGNLPPLSSPNEDESPPHWQDQA